MLKKKINVYYKFVHANKRIIYLNIGIYAGCQQSLILIHISIVTHRTVAPTISVRYLHTQPIFFFILQDQTLDV